MQTTTNVDMPVTGGAVLNLQHHRSAARGSTEGTELLGHVCLQQRFRRAVVPYRVARDMCNMAWRQQDMSNEPALQRLYDDATGCALRAWRDRDSRGMQAADEAMSEVLLAFPRRYGCFAGGLRMQRSAGLHPEDATFRVLEFVDPTAAIDPVSSGEGSTIRLNGCVYECRAIPTDEDCDIAWVLAACIGREQVLLEMPDSAVIEMLDRLCLMHEDADDPVSGLLEDWSEIRAKQEDLYRTEGLIDEAAWDTVWTQTIQVQHEVLQELVKAQLLAGTLHLQRRIVAPADERRPVLLATHLDPAVRRPTGDKPPATLTVLH